MQKPFGSKSFRITVLCQFLFDFLTCLMAVFYGHLVHTLTTTNEYRSPISCALWVSNFVFILPLVMSAFNVILLSFDRLMAVFAATSYNNHVALRLTISYVLITLSSLALSLPSCFLVQIVHLECHTNSWYFPFNIHQFNRIFPHVWTLATFLAPMIIFVANYVAVFIRLHCRKSFVYASSPKPVSKRAGIRFTLTVFALTIFDIICTAPENIYILLINVFGFNDDEGSLWHMCTTFLITLKSCSSPWIFFLIQPQIKKHLIHLITRCSLKKLTGAMKALSVRRF
ncbi:hypothetical protein FGIG_03399 [Fasciola gigantica]|uniref:G-protein coupled receptors family 1 profile domain-containing protein n=1 Tax=Fasciola gigantica TaxID=46835 RepID=A0A504Y3Y2_FASGI|nr:hypothetical protein FGIG_03399 [Fasciola gigantica]